MPKVTKKAKEKHADFSKAKLKLGKGKKAPSNATDTSFKARSIALPTQSPLNRADRASALSEPFTSTGLTLDEVISRLRHPNAGVRKDALGGIKEVLVAGGVQREVGKVVRAVGGVIADDEATVRKALLGFLGWYLNTVPTDSLLPHLPLLLLQTSSSLSHIFPATRLDACKLVFLLLAHFPEHVVGTWPNGGTNNILEGLRLAVGMGSDKGQASKLGGAGKAVALRALEGFVRSALGESGEEDDEGKKQMAIWLGEEGQSRHGKGKGRERTVNREGLVGDAAEDGYVVPIDGWTVGADAAWEIGRLGGEEAQDEQRGQSVLTELYLQLQPLLLSTFLESAPSAFSPSTSSSTSSTTLLETHLDLCLLSTSLSLLLARPILSATSPSSQPSEVRASLSDLLRRMSPYFPFPPRASSSSSATLSPAFTLNLTYAQIAALLAPRPVEPIHPASISARESAWKRRVRAVENAWAQMRAEQERDKGKGKGQGWALEEVAEWITATLSPSTDALAPSSLNLAGYKALLPIIWSLLVLPPPRSSEQDVPSLIGAAFFQHLARQGPASTIRAAGDHFAIAFIRVHEQRFPQWPFFLPPLRGGGGEGPQRVRRLIGEWVDSVPRRLWELGGKSESATAGLLGFLLEVGQRGNGGWEKPYSLIDPESFSGLTSRLAPFFHLDHPTRGSVPGPWTRLSGAAVRKLGWDVGMVWREWDEGGVLARAMDAAREGLSEGK